MAGILNRLCKIYCKEVPSEDIRSQFDESPEDVSLEQMATFEELFRDVARRFPERTALQDEKMSLSFSELDALSSSIAGFILERGTAKKPQSASCAREAAWSWPPGSGPCGPGLCICP